MSYKALQPKKYLNFGFSKIEDVVFYLNKLENWNNKIEFQGLRIIINKAITLRISNIKGGYIELEGPVIYDINVNSEYEHIIQEFKFEILNPVGGEEYFIMLSNQSKSVVQGGLPIDIYIPK